MMRVIASKTCRANSIYICGKHCLDSVLANIEVCEYLFLSLSDNQCGSMLYRARRAERESPGGRQNTKSSRWMYCSTNTGYLVIVLVRPRP